MSWMTIEEAFTSTLMDLDALHRRDVDELDVWSHKREVSLSVGALCDGLEAKAPGEEVAQLATHAQRVVSRLSRCLEVVDSEDRRTREKLEMARGAVGELLASIEALLRRA